MLANKGLFMAREEVIQDPTEKLGMFEIRELR